MTRIVAGTARGRALAVPAGTGTRPTSERAREGMFSSLTSLLRTFAGVRVLDLYAGTGALGLEALSRGAASAVLVEHDRSALTALRINAAALGLAGARVVASRVERFLADAAPGAAYDVVLADPPYDLAEDALAAVLTAALPLLAPDAVVVLERATRGAAPAWPAGLVELRSRRYGEATLWYGRAAPGA